MKEVKRKTTFRACDGREFLDATACEAYEELVHAREAYDGARQALGWLLAERAKTVDGVPFEFGLFKTYFWIDAGRFDCMPSIVQLEFWGRNWTWDDVPGTEQTRVVLIHFGNDDMTSHRRGIHYAIEELYFDRGNARQALKQAQE